MARYENIYHLVTSLNVYVTYTPASVKLTHMSIIIIFFFPFFCVWWTLHIIYNGGEMVIMLFLRKSRYHVVYKWKNSLFHETKPVLCKSPWCVNQCFKNLNYIFSPAGDIEYVNKWRNYFLRALTDLCYERPEFGRM